MNPKIIFITLLFSTRVTAKGQISSHNPSQNKIDFSIKSFSNPDLTESEIENLLTSNFKELFQKDGQSEESLGDKIAYFVNSEISNLEINDIWVDEEVGKRIDRLDLNSKEDFEIVCDEILSILKRISTYQALIGAERVLNAGDLGLTLEDVTIFISEESTLTMDRNLYLLKLEIERINEVLNFVPQSLHDQLVETRDLNTLFVNLRLILQQNLSRIIEEVFIKNENIQERGFETLADRFITIYKAMYNSKKDGLDYFLDPPISISFKGVFKSWISNINQNKLTNDQVIFMKSIISNIFEFLLENDESTDEIFQILKLMLIGKSKNVLVVSNLCTFFKKSLEDNRFSFDSRYLKNEKNLSLMRTATMDSIYQLGICNINSFSKENIRNLIEYIDLILNAPGDYFKYKMVYPHVMFEVSDTVVKDYEFYYVMYLFALRLRISGKLVNAVNNLSDLNEYVDTLYVEKIDASEIFSFNIEETYMLLKIGIAFQIANEKVSLSIRELPKIAVEAFGGWFEEIEFATFHKFIEQVYRANFKTVQVQGKGPSYSWENFSNFKFNNTQIQSLINRDDYPLLSSFKED
jgi:hypothetical protein